ncbi:hypothetical protein [Nostoc sp.]|uniref:hypothetical protein n=1 Tax=Nostoc sp. TaxID=1180 RepID=UPI002A5DD3B4|nr:hypothetical protein [Nostoc sp. S13]
MLHGPLLLAAKIVQLAEYASVPTNHPLQQLLLCCLTPLVAAPQPVIAGQPAPVPAKSIDRYTHAASQRLLLLLAPRQTIEPSLAEKCLAFATQITISGHLFLE